MRLAVLMSLLAAQGGVSGFAPHGVAAPHRARRGPRTSSRLAAVPPPPAALVVPALPPMPPVMGELAVYTARTVIAWGIPLALTALAVGTVGAMIAGEISEGKPSGKGKGKKGGGGPFAFLSGGMDGDDSGPEEYLTVKRLNDKLASFQYSLTAATEGRSKANIKNRENTLRRTLGEFDLTPAQAKAIEEGGRSFATKYQDAQDKVDKFTLQYRELAAEAGAASAKDGGEDSSDPGKLKKTAKWVEKVRAKGGKGKW